MTKCLCGGVPVSPMVLWVRERAPSHRYMLPTQVHVSQGRTLTSAFPQGQVKKLCGTLAFPVRAQPHPCTQTPVAWMLLLPSLLSATSLRVHVPVWARAELLRDLTTHPQKPSPPHSLSLNKRSCSLLGSSPPCPGNRAPALQLRSPTRRACP